MISFFIFVYWLETISIILYAVSCPAFWFWPVTNLFSSSTIVRFANISLNLVLLLKTTPAGVVFKSNTRFRDMFANLTIVDDEKRFVTGQNQNAGHETAYKMMEIVSNQ